MKRRSFIGWLLSAVGVATAQKAIMEGKNAVVCDSDSVKCPNGHASCKVINAPLVVGNDNHSYPEESQLFNYHVLRCDQCKVLFTLE